MSEWEKRVIGARIVDVAQWFCWEDLRGVVEPFPYDCGNVNCKRCGGPLRWHGWVDGYIVCPGSWVIRDDKGHCFVLAPSAFDNLLS